MSLHPARLQALNARPPRTGDYVLYWMQQAQRAHCNHALEYAISEANRLGLPLVVGFGLMAGYPDANRRHFHFLLQGLADTRQRLAERGIAFVVRPGAPDAVALALAERAALLVCDCGYLRHQQHWRSQVAAAAACAVVQVEADVAVPVAAVSGKAEFAARTLRPKLTKLLGEYLHPLEPVTLERDSLGLLELGLDVSDVEAVLATLPLDHSVAPVARFTGGTTAALAVFERFLQQRLRTYAENRNQPQTDDLSYMGMYLHFGQISPLYLALRLQECRDDDNRAVFLEELLVRRELSMNFVHYTPNYDCYDCVPTWAKKTLDEHRADPRPRVYSREQLEQAKTHDPYWNAAMQEMIYTGYMHNYMRMYWGKKILEWSKTPEEAYATAVYLNNKYFIDGRDANSYAGIGWLFGLHDRPWQERAVFGMVRYMNDKGLERKCDIKGYVGKVCRMR